MHHIDFHDGNDGGIAFVKFQIASEFFFCILIVSALFLDKTLAQVVVNLAVCDHRSCENIGAHWMHFHTWVCVIYEPNFENQISVHAHTRYKPRLTFVETLQEPLRTSLRTLVEET